MKKILGIFLLSFIFLLSCNKGDNILVNNQKDLTSIINMLLNSDMTINGDMAKALNIATRDFLRYHYPIERYEVILEKDMNYFYIAFVPKIIDYETAGFGHPKIGNSVTYLISMKEYKIEGRFLGK